MRRLASKPLSKVVNEEYIYIPVSQFQYPVQMYLKLTYERNLVSDYDNLETTVYHYHCSTDEHRRCWVSD